MDTTESLPLHKEASKEPPLPQEDCIAAPPRRRESKVPSIPKAVIIRDTLLAEAVQILELVNSQYGNGDTYLDQVFGKRITKSVANECIVEYLKSEGLDRQIRVKWSSKLACSACMASRGSRRSHPSHTMWLNSTVENFYLREKAILALADHEVGTHFLRTHNERLQLWSSERSKYRLSSFRSYQKLVTEEGLATLNTHLKLECKLLWKPALYYYAICMARTMDSSQLHKHLGKYLADPMLRDKVVYRSKRTLPGRTKPTADGCGWDQCYFTGAVKILRKLDEIDLTVLYSGKVAVEDLPRVKHIARTSVLKLPRFMSGPNGVASYSLALQEMKRENAI